MKVMSSIGITFIYFLETLHVSSSDAVTAKSSNLPPLEKRFVRSINHFSLL